MSSMCDKWLPFFGVGQADARNLIVPFLETDGFQEHNKINFDNKTWSIISNYGLEAILKFPNRKRSLN